MQALTLTSTGVSNAVRCKLSKHYLTLVLCTTVSVAAGLSGVRSRSILFIASGIAMVKSDIRSGLERHHSCAAAWTHLRRIMTDKMF